MDKKGVFHQREGVRERVSSASDSHPTKPVHSRLIDSFHTRGHSLSERMYSPFTFGGTEVHTSFEIVELLRSAPVSEDTAWNCYHFRLISSKPFARLSRVGACAQLKRLAPEYPYDEVGNLRLIETVIKQMPELIALAKLRRYRWVTFLHRPFEDREGQPSFLRIRFRSMHSIELNPVHLFDDSTWGSDGSFLLLSRIVYE